jgi:hypothetical protein
MAGKPTAGLSEALRDARELATTLNAATDELNTALTEAEQALISLELGVHGWVVIAAQENGRGRSLDFGKLDGAWRLYTETTADAWASSNGAMPLVNASREVRILAASKFPDLVSDLMAKVRTEVERVKESTAAVRSVVAELTPEPRPGDEDPF